MPNIVEKLINWLSSPSFEMVSKLETLLSLGTFLFAFITFWLVWARERRRKKLIRSQHLSPHFAEQINQYKGINTDKPVALLLSLLPHTPSIKVDVRAYLKSEEMPMPLKELTMPGITKETIAQFQQDLLKLKTSIEAQGYTEVHLFTSGPVSLGLLVGILLDNWKLVKVYHRQHGKYEYWYPLLKN